MSRAVACGCKSLVQLLGCLQMFLAVAWVGCKCSLPWLQVLSDQLVALTRVYRLISLLHLVWSDLDVFESKSWIRDLPFFLHPCAPAQVGVPFGSFLVKTRIPVFDSRPFICKI